MIKPLIIKSLKFLSGLKKVSGKQQIFVFRCDELGDFILWLGAAKILREYYPADKYHITLVSKPANRQLAELCPYWDEVWDFDLRQYQHSRIYRLKTIFKLMQADMVINPVLNRSLLIDNLIGYSNALARIGIDVKWNEVCYHSKAEIDTGNLNYTRLVRPDLSKHVININFDFAAALTGMNQQPFIGQLSFIPIQDPGFSDYFMVVPGAGSAARRWPAENFAAIINFVLEQRPDLKALICGTREEFELGEKVRSTAGQPDRIINYCGKSDLVELSSIVKNAKFLLSNDCATLHIAACFSVRSIGILGGAHIGLFFPYPDIFSVNSQAAFVRKECINCNWHCFRHPEDKTPYPCIEQVKVENVQSVICELLKTIK
jgi:ADP-heptose:LPS heptosyltransferase